MRVEVYLNNKTYIETEWSYLRPPAHVLDDNKAIRLYHELIRKWVTIPVSNIAYIVEDTE